MNTVLIKPVVTEQSMKGVPSGKYTFVVAQTATKDEIKKQVKELFGVTVLSIATTTTKGKSRRVGMRRQEISLPVSKKAVVTVKKGETISWFESATS